MIASCSHLDSRVSSYVKDDFAFTKLRARYKKWTGKSFEDKDMISFGLVEASGKLTNAGALLADDSPIRWSRLFCTRWNGLNKSGGTIDAVDDAEFSGSLIYLLENGEEFIKRNCRKMWRKTPNSREEILCLRTYSKGLDTWNEKVADLGRLLMRMSFR